MLITTLGDTALRIELGDAIDEPTHRRVQAALLALEAARLPGVSEVTSAYTTVTLFYDPQRAVDAGAPTDGIAGLVRGARARGPGKSTEDGKGEKPHGGNSDLLRR